MVEEYGMSLDINSRTWFFLTNLNALETLIVTLAKIVVYESRRKKTHPNIAHFQNRLKLEAKVEYNAAILNNEQALFEKKWERIKHLHAQEDSS